MSEKRSRVFFVNEYDRSLFVEVAPDAPLRLQPIQMPQHPAPREMGARGKLGKGWGNPLLGNIRADAAIYLLGSFRNSPI